MSNYMSPVEKIDTLLLEPIPTNRTINVVKATRDGRVTLLLASNGKVYSNVSERVTYTLGSGATQTSTMRALHRLGVITKAQMNEHLAAGARRSQRQKMKLAADSIARDAEVLGFKLTKAQQAKVDAARGANRDAGVSGA